MTVSLNPLTEPKGHGVKGVDVLPCLYGISLPTTLRIDEDYCYRLHRTFEDTYL